MVGHLVIIFDDVENVKKNILAIKDRGHVLIVLMALKRKKLKNCNLA